MKIIRDPIYGYIKLEDEFCDIVDSAQFQRLRRISQTSYYPLYPSSTHNRFIHSLGVFYLGSLVADSIFLKCNQISELKELKEKLSAYVRIFKIACLLHDVGHSPFSHTTENFFLKDFNDYSDLHQSLIKCGIDEGLKNDIPKANYACAKPHEIMSAIVGIKSFPSFFKSKEEKSFFARCITGYINKFDSDNSNDLLLSFQNVLIKLLNSNVIDVDKLDYLIRDAYVSGYQTISIDYQRFAFSLEIFVENNRCNLCFDKKGISVLENIIYAHDYERKWVQSHPMVIYESNIIKRCIYEMKNKLDDNFSNNLFSINSLTLNGLKQKEGNYKIKLLSDDDIIFLIKNYCNNSLVEELFDRSKRKKCFWKTEAEFNALFKKIGSDSDTMKKIINSLTNLCEYLSMRNMYNPVLNDDSYKDIVNKNKIDGKIKHSFLKANVATNDNLIKIANVFRKFAKENNIPFNFYIERINYFHSGFSKTDFKELQIMFPNLNNMHYKFGDVTTPLNHTARDDELFFIFYDSCNVDSEISVASFITELIDAFIH